MARNRISPSQRASRCPIVTPGFTMIVGLFGSFANAFAGYYIVETKSYSPHIVTVGHMVPLSRLPARSFGLLLGGEPVDDGTLFGTVRTSMQFVVQRRQFHVRLKPAGVVLDDPFQLLGGGFVFA
jgi:hypothetical protein